jgi:Mrp family chromosome partitioning ATPase
MIRANVSRVTVTVSGPTGSGKSRIALEIEVALKAAGIAVEWSDIDGQRQMEAEAHSEATGGWQPEMPEVLLQEINTPVSIAKGMAMMSVPDVWSDVERDGMANAFTEASQRHGLYESLFAAASWLLRHRAAQVP